MSTKNSLFYSDEIHIFKECFDDDSVFLKINKENLKIEFCFSLENFLKIVKTIDVNSLEKQSQISDEEIKNYCKSRVQQRYGSNGIVALSGLLIFGDAKLAEEEQINNGIKYFSSIRDKLVKLFAVIKKTHTSNFNFGLEDILEFDD